MTTSSEKATVFLVVGDVMMGSMSSSSGLMLSKAFPSASCASAVMRSRTGRRSTLTLPLFRSFGSQLGRTVHGYGAEAGGKGLEGRSSSREQGEGGMQEEHIMKGRSGMHKGTAGIRGEEEEEGLTLSSIGRKAD